MTCPDLLERNRDLNATEHPATIIPLPCVAGGPICPMTGTTTCTDDESKQRQCPSC